MKIAAKNAKDREEKETIRGQAGFPTLIARASYYRIMRDYKKAWEDLAEVKEIAELGAMELYLVDYHLEAGRLSQGEEKLDAADAHVREANILIGKMGYGRRSGIDASS